MSAMNSFHVNSEGNAGLCQANVQCPFGEETEHFATAQEARAHYEVSQSSKVFAPLRRSKMFRHALKAGAMTVIAVSLAGCSTIAKADGQTTPYNSPDQPTASDAYTPAPTQDSKIGNVNQKIDDAYASGKDWIKEHGPGAAEKAKELLEKLKAKVNTAAPQNQVAADGVYWQVGALTPTPAQVAQAQATLNTLVVTPESNVPYDRAAQFGRSFQTGIAGAVEHRDVPTATFKNSTAQARVVDGHFTDPYTGKDVHVIGGKAYDADIDHLVPLSEAWDSGASAWSQQKRVQLANDMDNLIYVGSGINRSKSDKDAAEFLPSYEPAVCQYVISQIRVKGNYKLSVDSAEKAAMQQVINSRCNS